MTDSAQLRMYHLFTLKCSLLVLAICSGLMMKCSLVSFDAFGWIWVPLYVLNVTVILKNVCFLQDTVRDEALVSIRFGVLRIMKIYVLSWVKILNFKDSSQADCLFWAYKFFTPGLSEFQDKYGQLFKYSNSKAWVWK